MIFVNVLKDKVLPDVPLMIGVDHSGTGGCIEALAEKYGKGNLSVVMCSERSHQTIRCVVL